MNRFKIEAVDRQRLSEVKAGHRIFVAAELYGYGVDNRHLAVSVEVAEKALEIGGQAMLLDLVIGNESLPVIIKDVARDHLKGRLIHIDFYQVRDDVKVVVEAALKPVGKSAAISNFGGTLVANAQKLKIECLPKDLISVIEVDLSKLANLNDVIRVEDLTLPDGVVAKTGPRDPVFSVAASRKAKSAASGGETEAAKPAAKK